MNKHYHFIGIGGIGMGALAKLILDLGHRVSGSDLKENAIVLQLKDRGVIVNIGHDASNIEYPDFVVYSSAVDPNNPELLAARKKQLAVLKRAELLAELMTDYTSITVAGAHGKTTTTSMVSHLLTSAGLEPTTAIGGIVNGTKAHAAIGSGKYFVAELDESDGTFLNFSPAYSIITNIDFEHVDFYHNWNNILKAYYEFIQKTRRDGVLIVCGEDQRLLGLAKDSGRKFQSYGFSSKFDVSAEDFKINGMGSQYDCVVDGKKLGKITLNVPGRHNALNSLSCVALALNLKIPFETISKGLSEFRGVQRRFQVKGRVHDILVVDDYGHHPTEVEATLKAALGVKKNRLIVAFQPHRYSRMKFLWNEFSQCFDSADLLIITDIYAASEKPLDGINAQNFCQGIQAQGKPYALYLPKDKIVDYLIEIAQPGDVLLTLGAGDITKLSEELVKSLQVKFQGQPQVNLSSS